MTEELVDRLSRLIANIINISLTDDFSILEEDNLIQDWFDI